MLVTIPVDEHHTFPVARGCSKDPQREDAQFSGSLHHHSTTTPRLNERRQPYWLFSKKRSLWVLQYHIADLCHQHEAYKGKHAARAWNLAFACCMVWASHYTSVLLLVNEDNIQCPVLCFSVLNSRESAGLIEHLPPARLWAGALKDTQKHERDALTWKSPIIWLEENTWASLKCLSVSIT